MRRNTLKAALASTAIAALTLFGAVAPAQAAASTSTNRDAPAVDVTSAQVLAGKTLHIGDSGPAVSDAQTRLTNVGIATPVTGNYTDETSQAVWHFRQKFFLNYGERDYQAMDGVLTPRTFRTLLTISKNGTNVPGKCKTQAKAICVDKTQKVLRYYVKGHLRKTMDARFGAQGMATREGNFHIQNKVANGISALTGTRMLWSMYFSGGQAVHYSMFFAADWYDGASHGCVNIRDKAGVRWLYKQSHVGDLVKVYH